MVCQVFPKISWLTACHRKGLASGLSGLSKNIMAPRLPQGRVQHAVCLVFAKISWLPACHRKVSKQSVRFLQKYLGLPPATGRVACELPVFAKLPWLPACHRKGITCGLSGFCKNIMASRLSQEGWHEVSFQFLKKYHSSPPATGRV